MTWIVYVGLQMFMFSAFYQFIKCDYVIIGLLAPANSHLKGNLGFDKQIYSLITVLLNFACCLFHRK